MRKKERGKLRSVLDRIDGAFLGCVKGRRDVAYQLLENTSVEFSFGDAAVP